MKIIQYLCEFFFTNFWHWLGLVIVLDGIFGGISRLLSYVGEKLGRND